MAKKGITELLATAAAAKQNESTFGVPKLVQQTITPEWDIDELIKSGRPLDGKGNFDYLMRLSVSGTTTGIANEVWNINAGGGNPLQLPYPSLTLKKIVSMMWAPSLPDAAYKFQQVAHYLQLQGQALVANKPKAALSTPVPAGLSAGPSAGDNVVQFLFGGSEQGGGVAVSRYLNTIVDTPPYRFDQNGLNVLIEIPNGNINQVGAIILYTLDLLFEVQNSLNQ